jgi:NitT/TauT family transport system substrate-binding protein
VTTDLIASPKFLKAHPNVVKNFLRAHVDLTDWINKNSAQAKQILNQQLQKETGKALPAEVLDEAFSRMSVTYDPIRSALQKATQQAYDEGFLGRTPPDLSGLFDLTLLNEVLREKKDRPVQ